VSAVAEPTLYLFDGYNLLHAGTFTDRDELVDTLASYVAGRGARGVVVFDGVGEERTIGPLAVRFTGHADDLLERLAAENRKSEQVCIVSSDHAVRWTSGQEVRKVASRAFLAELAPAQHVEREQTGAGGRVGDLLDEETRAKLEELRRGRK
jgi:predicted RNA-binding protein with PIN domain